MPELDLQARPDAVPLARSWAREVLVPWGLDHLRPDLDLALSELLANAVLHAPGPARVVLERAQDGLRLEVRDSSPTSPVRRVSGGGATTGRGLNLVAALADGWGVGARSDGEAGKTVWCVLTGTADEQIPDLDVDTLLASFDDDDDDGRVVVVVGDAPAELLRQAKDHLDSLLREIALAEGAGSLPREVVEPMATAARRFAEARTQLRALLTRASSRGEQRVELRFHLPPATADAGEEYLTALLAADAFARDRRMLALESPVEHRVLREWYVGRLVAGLRAAAGRGPGLDAESFEARLLTELHRVDRGRRAAQRSAQLQRATARLAAADTVEEIGLIAAAEGLDVLRAAGATLTRAERGATVMVVELGVDAGVGARYERSGPLTGPSTAALRSGTAVFVESREERDQLFPQLAELQPEAIALAAVPLRVAGTVIGALRFSWTEPHVFSADERELLEALAAQTGLAVARADALAQLRALRDELDRLVLATGQVSSIDLGVLRTLYGEAPVGIAVLDHDGRYLRVNEVLAAANGRSVAAHPGRSLEEVAGPLGGDPIRELADRVLEGGTAVEHEIAEPDGVRRWRTSWFPVRDAQEQVQAAAVLLVDITEQRQAEERTRLLAALGDRLARDRTQAGVLEAVAAVLVPGLVDWASVHLIRDDGQIWCPLVRHADPELEIGLQRLAGSFVVTPDQPHGAGRVIGTGLTEQLPDIDDAVLEAIAPGDRDFAAGIRNAGATGGIIVPLRAGGQVVGALSVARSSEHAFTASEVDVVEDVGRRAGAALQAVRALSTSVRLDIALDAADVGSYDWHVRTGHLDWDDRLFRLLDVDAATFDGRMETFFARLHPDDVAPMGAAMERAVRDVGELQTVYRIVTRDGSIRWLEARGRALPGADGETERLVGVAVDVTDRQQGRARAEQTLEDMADAFFQLDGDGRFRYLNRQAEVLLERSRHDLLGRSLWEAFPAAPGSPFRSPYERAVREGAPVRVEQQFPGLDPLFDVRVHPGPDGLAVYFVDAGAQRATERERDHALTRLAQADAIGSALTQTLDLDEALAKLAGLLVPSLADLCSIDLRDGDARSGARAVVTTAGDPRKAEAMQAAERIHPRRHNPGSAVHQVLAGRPLVHLVVTPEHLAAVAVDPVQAALWQQIDMRFACVVPLAARGRVFGAISLIRTGSQAQPWSDDDLVFVQDIGRRAGLLVDNAAQYTAQRAVAEGLQRSLLPELPTVPGLALGAAYQPSSSAALVGGDWYDAFVLQDSALGLVVGDVMGHDLTAAAAMGQLRSVLRTCAADDASPGHVLGRLDRLVASFAMADLATVVYGRLEPLPDGGARLVYANAGHPPALVLSPDGAVTQLDGGRGIMIGTGVEAPRPEATYVLAPGDTVLLYTDGLVERRGRDLDEQVQELGRTAVELLARTSTPRELCEGLLATVRADGGTDDAAVMAVRLS